MPPSSLGAAPAEIAARLQLAVSAITPGPVRVYIGDEILGCRNVGVDLPPGRRSAVAARSLRLHARDALEREGVILAETALAPRVAGHVRGTVRVAEAPVSYNDSSHLLRGRRGVDR